MSSQEIPLEQFSQVFGTYTELSSIALGGRVCSVSDDFFAAVFHLLLVEAAPSLDGQFGPRGALYSGWETRRHNTTYDWCIIKLGTTGVVHGFDIDTSHFDGNEAPEVSVDALTDFDDDEDEPEHDDPRWSEILQRVPLGPNSRHLFTISTSSPTRYVKLNMYPDGGIARFRVYGLVNPVLPKDPHEQFDLAHVFVGGRVVSTSDQHFGVGSNLILPGRGKHMGDGWETKRSREKDHKDWAVIKLGVNGYLTQVEIDTADFKGNFPQSCEIHATNTPDVVPSVPDDQWTQILPRTSLGPHRRHFFPSENTLGRAYSHIKLTIYPDGGLKRIRVVGSQQIPTTGTVQTIESCPETRDTVAPLPLIPTIKSIPALPLTPEVFAPFGQVIQGYSNRDTVPRNTKVAHANQGSALKFHKLSLTESSYPRNSGATTGLSVYRCQPINTQLGGVWDIKLLERHKYSNQAFIPMAGGNVVEGGEGLTEHAKFYLVIVAKDAENDTPDLENMKAFLASTGQGIVYNAGVWHHPMAVLEKQLDLTCIETQIGDGGKLDCEVVDINTAVVQYRIEIPALSSSICEVSHF